MPSSSTDPSKGAAPLVSSPIDRRGFLKAAGVAGATVAVAGCDYNSPVPVPRAVAWLEDPVVPYENVLPYVVQDSQIVPGNPVYFASRCNECPSGCGTVAKNREGRIVHVEGNAHDPVGGGNLCAMGTASIQATYSPDRIKGPLKAGAEATWDDALSTIGAAAKGAAGALAWVGRYRSGAQGALVRQAIAAMGGKVLMWEPLGDDALRAATKAVFGRDAVPSWHLDDAHTVLSFGADFTTTWLSPSEQSRGWANSRDPHHGDFVSRTVVVAPRLGNAGTLADLHLAAKPGTEVDIALALARLVAEKKGYSGPARAVLGSADAAAAASAAGISAERLEEVAGWLAEASSVVIPGGAADSVDPTALATAVLVLNEVCGNIGTTVRFGDEHLVDGRSTTADIAALLEQCRKGQVKVLFIDDLDLVFNLPAELDVRGALDSVSTVVVLSNEPNDTTVGKVWVLPPGTTQETWGDGHVRAGIHVLQQQAMRPLYDTRSVGDILLGLAAAAGLAPTAAATEAPADDTPAAPPPLNAPVPVAAPAEDAAAEVLNLPDLAAPDFASYLQAWWKAVVWEKAGRPGDFQTWWVGALQRGGWFKVPAATGATFQLTTAPKGSGAPAGSDPTLVVFAHPFLYDGRHANKPWAQEVPEPVSSWSWTTWAELSPATASKLGLEKGDRLTLRTDKGEIEVDWFGNPSVRDDVIGVVLGNGKKAGGRYSRFGTNPVDLLGAKLDADSGAMVYSGVPVKAARSGGKAVSIPYIGSIDQQGRYINYVVSKEDLAAGGAPGSIVPMHHPPVDERLTKAGLNDMFPEPDHPTYRFAMSVDLNRCTGCGSCMTACHSENNIPVVGPEQMNRSRYMGWIRLSRYFEGEGETPDVRYQPVMCQHCSHAPCEGVCPVLATYHNLDGLNAMIYNRCVGTRYCANNCPYTARRFNFHTFRWPESFDLMLNPDVSTREMGVMEKCTFCVQRLRAVKDTWRDEGQTVPHEELDELTACAKACPADAIVFGNAKAPDSAVSKRFAEPRAYAMLGELNTKPGVRYLARVNHIPSAAHHGGHGGGHEDASGHGDSHGSEETPAAGGHH